MDQIEPSSHKGRAPRARIIENLHFKPGEGYLVGVGERRYLVYTGESKLGWDVCPTEPDRGRWAFKPHIVVGEASRAAALRALDQLLGQEETEEA